MKYVFGLLILLNLHACRSICCDEDETSRPPVDLVDASLWRGWNATDLPDGWEIGEGVIHLAQPGAGDLITRDTFEDFVLELSWKIAPGGNSGIFFHATEEGGAIYESAPEMQVLDDEAHADAGLLTKSGANYALHATVPQALRAPGEWNDVRLSVRGGRVTHELNGTILFTYELWSPAWEALVAASKFSAWPIYGRAARGYIGLQDHGSEVWFRDVKVTKL